GPYAVTNGYAMTPQPPSVYIDGFYCNGIAAIAGPVSGLPGNVYQLGVFVPDLAALLQNFPDLKNFTFPAQSSIQIAISGVYSQTGVFINIK
ncbi:MAG TPA: hypothetical protein VHW24_11310, partial [Bryobacteraceae bacterium]|nr:hypothetical protein [Bryobacteraceae bacterium]